MNKEISIYNCSFEAYVERASVLIKFPCLYFLEWKTSNNQKCVQGRNRPSAVNTQINFKETLQLNTEMFFDKGTKQFLKKETLLNLNLISKSRQDQVKLVGRVTLDLAELANRGTYEQLQTHRLSYCSVDGEISFSAVMKYSKLTDLKPQDLDKSSYNQFRSFYSCQNQIDPRREAMIEYDQQTSVQFAAKKNYQNAIDQPTDKRTKNFNQTFFIMPSSPRQNGFNRTNQLPPKLTRQKSIQAETVHTLPRNDQFRRTFQSGKDLNGTCAISKETDLWNHDKPRFRDEIDGNKQKIEQLQKKIVQLCVNLQDSKRQVQQTQRQNKQKQELIQQLKNSVTIEKPRAQAEYRELQQRYEKLYQERKDQDKKSRITEQTLRRELALSNASCDNLRKETQQLRKIWIEKKQYYDDKLKHSEFLIKEKEAKINEINAKIDEISKYKYQYELMKELNEQKQSKMKIVQKDLVKLSKELEQIKKDNLGQQNYRLKINFTQLSKNIEELTIRYNKCQQEVSRYRQNYIKISTAYEIQTKNYQNNKEKYTQLQTNFFQTQKESIQSKNTIANMKKQYEQLESKYTEAYNSSANLSSFLQAARKRTEELQKEVSLLREDKEGLKDAINKMKVQDDIRRSQNQNQIKRIEASFNNSLQLKQRAYNAEKKDLQNQLSSAQVLIIEKDSQYQHSKESFQFEKSSLCQQLSIKEQELKKKQTTVQRLNEVIVDKQQIIKMYKDESEGLKETNQQLIESLTRMKQKEKQLTETIIVLEQQSQKIMMMAEEKEQIQKELQKRNIEVEELILVKDELNRTIDNQNENASQLEENMKELQLKFDQLQAKIKQMQCNLDEKNEEFEQKCEQLIQKNAELDSKREQLYQKNAQFDSKCNDHQQTLNSLQELRSQYLRYREETSQTLNQIDKQKAIISQINERYEQHLRIQQRYVQEIKMIRMQKEELEVLLNSNNNEMVVHNNQLQARIQELQSQLQKMDQLIRPLEQEKKQLEELILQTKHNEAQSHSKTEEYESKAITLRLELLNTQNKVNDKQKIIQSMKNQIEDLRKTVDMSKSKYEEIVSLMGSKSQEILFIGKKIQEYQQAIMQKSDRTVELEQQIIDLEQQLSIVKEELALKEEQGPYNEEIVQNTGTVDEEHRASQREEELQEMLFESDRKKQNLQARVASLLSQIDELQRPKKTSDSPQASQVLYSNFSQFQREQLNKIIQQQRKQIDRLQSQTKRGSDSSMLQQRIAQLQDHIVELQSSFKLEIQKILAEQQQYHKDENGTLTVINEQNSEDQILYRSQRSLVNSLSRIKSSFDGIELVELREKVHGLQEEKVRLEEEYGMMEEQKFNLLSTINEKDIQIEDLIQCKTHLSLEIKEQQDTNDDLHAKIKALITEIDALKSQLTFGSTLNFPNEQTRSEAFIRGESRIIQDKDTEIEHLKAEVERQKSKAEELQWYIKDLEMQLETVTQNLNQLNASSMNSLLVSTERISFEDDRHREVEQGYSKEKLLQNLKKNQQLKQLSHNLIRALKQKQKDSKQQENLFRDLLDSKNQIRSCESDGLYSSRLSTIRDRIASLIKEFQLIKIYIMRSEGNKLKEEIEHLIDDKDIMKSVLTIEQRMKEIQLDSEKEGEVMV